MIKLRNLFYHSHGYGSYVGKFAYVGKLFVDQGYDFIGMDFKGFGYSEGTRGLIESREDFYQEGYEFYVKSKQFYKEQFPNADVPIYTFGYS